MRHIRDESQPFDCLLKQTVNSSVSPPRTSDIWWTCWLSWGQSGDRLLMKQPSAAVPSSITGSQSPVCLSSAVSSSSARLFTHNRRGSFQNSDWASTQLGCLHDSVIWLVAHKQRVVDVNVTNKTSRDAQRAPTSNSQTNSPTRLLHEDLQA